MRPTWFIAVVLGITLLGILPSPTAKSVGSDWPNAPLAIPSDGWVHWIFSSSHNGIDIWTNENSPGSGRGNRVYLPHSGTLIRRVPDYDNTIVGLIFEHNIDASYSEFLPTDPDTGDPILHIWTFYWHMADENSPTSYINSELEEGQTYHAGTYLGDQGNRRQLSSSVVVHLHLTISRKNSESGAIDPTPYLGPDFSEPRTIADPYRVKYNGPLPVDVYLIVDLSGSFTDDLPNFKAQAPGIISSLKASNPSTQFGLGKFEDYPIYPFGSISYGDKAYERLVDLTFDTDQVSNTIAGLFTRYGVDGPESQLPALFQAATGTGQNLSGVGFPGASIPSDQQASFREEAAKLILLWTDAPFHQPGDPGVIPYPGPSFDEVVSAILALPGDSPKVVGIFASGVTGASPDQGIQEQFLETEEISALDGLSDLEAIAAATGALAPVNGVDCDGDGTIDIAPGQPLVCSISSTGEGIGQAIVALVEAGQKPAAHPIYLPIVLKNADGSPPSGTPTHTPTPTKTPTPTATPTPTSTPSGPPPAAPSNLQATPLDSNSIQLDWVDNSNNESGFEIYDGSAFVTTVGANTTSYTVGSLGINSYHCFHIFAFNDSGISPWTDWACAITISPPLTGTVTDNTNPVAGTEVLLRFYNGSSWSTYATTTTNSSGDYQFANPPLLGGDQSLYILWLNNGSNSGRLSSWSCFTNTWYTTDPDAYECNFDLGNIDLLLPTNGATISLPHTFTWHQRPPTTENYELNLGDVSDYDPHWWTGPLGYVDNYTLSGLPPGFVPGQQYGWWMWVYGPDGYGISYYYYTVTFSNTGITSLELESAPLPADISKENVEMIAPPQTR